MPLQRRSISARTSGRLGTSTFHTIRTKCGRHTECRYTVERSATIGKRAISDLMTTTSGQGDERSLAYSKRTADSCRSAVLTPQLPWTFPRPRPPRDWAERVEEKKKAPRKVPSNLGLETLSSMGRVLRPTEK